MFSAVVLVPINGGATRMSRMGCHFLFYIVFTFTGKACKVHNDVYIYIYTYMYMSTTWRTSGW